MQVEEVKISDIENHPNNPRVHNDNQIRLIEKSIKKFGYTNPVILSADGIILAGHARVKAAIQMGQDTIPCIRTKLTGKEADAYLIADNRLTELAQYDRDILDELLGGLPDDLVELTGFEVNAIDSYLDSNESNSAEVILENTEETAYSPNLKPVFSNPQVSNEDLEQARENIEHVTDKNVKQINAFCPNCGHEFMIGV